MKIFLTGINGQVGHELYERLKDTHEIIAPTREQLDLTNLSKVTDYLAQTSPQLIINAAAFTAVDKAETEIEQAFKLNTHLPETLALFAGARGIRLVHFSTDYVYPGDGQQPRDEKAITNPLSVYGKSKLAGDIAVQKQCPNAVIFRTAWVYSYRGKNFLNTMLKLAQERETLSIVNDQVGSPTSAEVIADYVLRALQHEDLKGVYHLVTTGYASWHEFANEIFTQAKKNVLPLAVETVNGIPTSDYPTPATRPLNSRLSTAKLEQKLGIALPSWQQALTDTMAKVKG
ncbi:dTDP-4-dehydrorhamnose reductase [Idiomarina sp.]|uniref:dTDP-4-dehydrorhamnose reductase n=1 Tax=Idiomarina sp. TaxID=1874361 RepID=UPI0025BD2518|nr:dTDP-4-dehydrorhamnose reductase [Idiomarina sp.]